MLGLGYPFVGHTVGTVSKALHDKPGLAPKTREYILKVAQENGYIGNALAGSLLAVTLVRRLLGLDSQGRTSSQREEHEEEVKGA